MGKLKYFIPLITFFGLAVFLMRGIELDPEELPSPLINQPVPAFSLSELSSSKILTADDLRGQVYLLNVWATWCISCKMEHPYLLNLAKQGVKIIGINYKDDSEQAKKWLDELGNPYVWNLVDQRGNLGLDLGVFGAPETFIVDKNGIIRYKHVGVIDERVWQKLLPIYTKSNNE